MIQSWSRKNESCLEYQINCKKCRKNVHFLKFLFTFFDYYLLCCTLYSLRVGSPEPCVLDKINPGRMEIISRINVSRNQTENTSLHAIREFSHWSNVWLVASIILREYLWRILISWLNIVLNINTWDRILSSISVDTYSSRPKHKPFFCKNITV